MFLHKFYICEKSCLWDIGQNALNQLEFLNRLFLWNKSMKQADTNWQKLKVFREVFGWTWSKYGYDQSGLWNLNWLCISRMYRWNYFGFWHAGTNSHKLKDNSKYFGWTWYKMGRVRFGDSWFVFHESSWSFHES